MAKFYTRSCTTIQTYLPHLIPFAVNPGYLHWFTFLSCMCPQSLHHDPPSFITSCESYINKTGSSCYVICLFRKKKEIWCAVPKTFPCAHDSSPLGDVIRDRDGLQRRWHTSECVCMCVCVCVCLACRWQARRTRLRSVRRCGATQSARALCGRHSSTSLASLTSWRNLGQTSSRYLSSAPEHGRVGCVFMAVCVCVHGGVCVCEREKEREQF